MGCRIAVLILAHRPDALPYLAALLPEPFDLFVHYDAKAGDPPTIATDNLRYITPRRAVFWGGFSMVEASLDLLSAARAAGAYERYVLLSADSLPLRSVEALSEALLWPDVEYIELIPLADQPATRGASYEQIRAMVGAEHAGRFHNFRSWDSLLTTPTAKPNSRSRTASPPSPPTACAAKPCAWPTNFARSCHPAPADTRPSSTAPSGGR